MKRPMVTAWAIRRCAAATMATVLLLPALGGCVNKTPKGQVVAVVNGAEVTTQDLRAEQRALGTASFNPQDLTQRVVSRVLLAQAAHADKLDAYAGFPADMLRLRQDYLAQQLIRTEIKPPPPPTPAQVNAFIQAHPLVFDHRMRLVLDELQFKALDGLNALQATNTLSEIEARLNALNTPVERRTITVDTAGIAPDLAKPLVQAPLNQLVLIRGTNATLAAVVQQRTPVVLSAEQTQALGRRLLTQLAGEQALEAKLQTLRSRASVAYQPGYAPGLRTRATSVREPTETSTKSTS